MNDAHLTELLGTKIAGRHERREVLRPLGRERRLAAYRRGELCLPGQVRWEADELARDRRSGLSLSPLAGLEGYCETERGRPAISSPSVSA